jgi:hypothetical protein
LIAETAPRLVAIEPARSHEQVEVIVSEREREFDARRERHLERARGVAAAKTVGDGSHGSSIQAAHPVDAAVRRAPGDPLEPGRLGEPTTATPA